MAGSLVGRSPGGLRSTSCTIELPKIIVNMTKINIAEQLILKKRYGFISNQYMR